jgi:hypothetical protein
MIVVGQDAKQTTPINLTDRSASRRSKLDVLTPGGLSSRSRGMSNEVMHGNGRCEDLSHARR